MNSENENQKFVKKKIKDGNLNKIMTIPKDLDDNEKEYRKMLEELNIPISEDPTKIEKNEESFNKKFLIDTFKNVSLFGIYKNFYNIEPPTPEEKETLRYCKLNMLNNLQIYSGFGFISFTGINVYYRNIFPIWFKGFSLLTGTFLGGLFGVLISTKFTMKQLYGLGPEFILGSKIINEVEDLRMDKVNKNFENKIKKKNN